MSRRKYYNHNDDGSAAVMSASWFTPNDKDGPGPRSKPVIKRSSATSRLRRKSRSRVFTSTAYNVCLVSKKSIALEINAL